MSDRIFYLLAGAFFVLSALTLFKFFKNVLTKKEDLEIEFPYFSVFKYIIVVIFIIYAVSFMGNANIFKNIASLTYLISLVVYSIIITLDNRKVYFFKDYLFFNGKKISYEYLKAIEIRDDPKKGDRFFISISNDRIFYTAKMKMEYKDELSKYLKKKINKKFKVIKN